MQIESILCKIISHEMGLTTDRVWIQTENRKIPYDDGIYITVGLFLAKPLSNQSRFDRERNIQHQVVTLNGMFQVSVFSRSVAAMERTWEVISSLQSSRAVEMMEKYQFRIHEITWPITNISHVEGGSQLFHYVTTVAVTWANHKETSIDYFDKFSIQGSSEEVSDDWDYKWGNW
jgi:hypothetical protein